MTAPWSHCYRVARDKGLVSALTELPPVSGAGGHALVPRGAVPTGAAELCSFILPDGEVVAIKGAEPADASSALGLVWLRLGLSEALRDEVMRHLHGRRLLRHQMVKSDIADGLLEHLEVRAALTGAGPGDLAGAELDRLHARITTADRMLVRLLGASGYLSDGPGQTIHVSGLLADVHQGEHL
ncbi:hypothetical protein [Streptomyces sp. YGL11-2]|uniref:hypothetical protein n=1 Tax=Streptomyces sp. YGL11-2 TaxID=3414028 RepID=UPI003CF029A7